MPKKLSFENVVVKLNKIHNNKYDYSKLVYKNMRSVVVIVCPIHGEFEQVLVNHSNGKGCPDCGKERSKIRSFIDTSVFIERSVRKHGNIYDYSKTIYMETRKKVIVICSVHNEFLVIAGEHLRGSGCPDCKGGNKKSLGKFIEQGNKKHNHKYDYSKFIYINNLTNGIIICPIHGEFEQMPVNHLVGRGCPSCGIISTKEKNTKSQEDFILQAIIKHNSFYDYSKVEYKGSFEKVIVGCPKHGYFKQEPSNHLFGVGCPDCAKEIANYKRTKSQKDFILQATIKHNGFYDYSKVEYKGSFEKVIVICPTHNEFKQAPSSHLNGNGCPSCKFNSVSKVSQAWLDEMNIPLRYREKVVKIEGKRYRVDGYDSATYTVYEFYGDYWHGNPKKYNADGVNTIRKKTFGDLYRETVNRENIIKSAGYNIIFMWEGDYLEKQKSIN